MPNGKIENFYMTTALNLAELSYAEKKRVGCIIVKQNRIISMGYNGTPNGFDNRCEDKVVTSFELKSYDLVKNLDNEIGIASSGTGAYELKTVPEVIHAEMNAISKVARSTESCEDADLYCTLSPCIECAKMIIQSGIKRVFYHETYRSLDGLNLLEKANILYIKI